MIFPSLNYEEKMPLLISLINPFLSNQEEDESNEIKLGVVGMGDGRIIPAYTVKTKFIKQLSAHLTTLF